MQEGQISGTGLGLFGVRTRAEGLLGTCGARHNTESSTGTGTVLWFALPYIPNLDASNSMQSAVASPKPGQISAASAFRSLQIHPGPSAHEEESARTGRTLHTSSPSAGLSLQHSTETTVPIMTEISSRKVVSHSRSPKLLSAGSSLNQSTAEVLIRALKLTAMVVEDTPTVRKLMQKLLLSMGFESVVCYENGSKGLEAMMAAPVDIVFSDVQMPIMTGPEVRVGSRLHFSHALEIRRVPFSTASLSIYFYSLLLFVS